MVQSSAFGVLIITAIAMHGITTAAWSSELVMDDDLADRTSRQWTYADLEVDAKHAMQGRSFANGQQIYRVAKCNVCHRMNGDGNEFGPDLASLDRQWTPTKILLHTLEPSHEINREYRTEIFELESGKVISGLITAVGLGSVKVVENPLIKRQPKTIKRADIYQRRTSRQSIMPTGLLNKLTRPEILDLLAYVHSGGNDQDSIFQGSRNDQ